MFDFTQILQVYFIGTRAIKKSKSEAYGKTTNDKEMV